MNKIKQNTREVLKSIPSVDSIILDTYKKFNITFHHSLLKQIIKEEIKQLKFQIINNNIVNDIEKILYKRLSKRIKENLKNRLQSVINGTGIVLHTGLGRAPIDKAILKKTIESIYPYSNLEFNLDSNSRGERNNHISYLINSILSCESSIILNNNAAAVLLALNTLSDNKEVIISRGELVEIGGSFRIPDVINKANCKMIEVGTTNKTHLKDFSDAINDNTGLIMIAHTSNYKVVGFTESVEIKEIVKLARKNKIPVFLDLGSGAFINYQKFGLPNEKTIQHYLKMGIDLISFSGDKLLGGIQSGFICGKQKIVKKLHQNSMYRALRCDKITISIMENTLRTYKDKDSIDKNNLTFNLLTRNRKEIKLIGQKILKSINNTIIEKYNLELVDSFVQAGSGSLPVENIESMAIRINPSILKASEISLKFRKSSIPIIGYIKGKKFYIDLKAIPTSQVKDLITSLKNCLI